MQLPESDWVVKLEIEDWKMEDGMAPLDLGRWTVVLDADKIRGGLVLRTRRAGERFCPGGMGGKHKSLHEFMIDEKIPRHLRDLIPILADDEKILWVCGERVDERAKVKEETSRVLSVQFLRMSA
jgi:tRNA(Ile)-lysidine synthase